MTIFRTVALVMILLVALALHPFAPTVAVILLGAWALGGSERAIQALTLVVLIKFLNPGIYRYEGSFGLWAWLALGVAGIRIFIDNLRIRTQRHPVIPWLLLYSSIILLGSMFFSHYAVVSIFKILSFSYAAAALLIGFKITAKRSVDWAPWFVGNWIAVIVLSAATLLVPSIGFLRNGTGFQGILSHPQTLGVFLAPMVAWVTARLLFSSGRRPYWLYLVGATAWIFLFLTAARTAVIAVVAGFIVILLVALVRRPDWRRSIQNGLLGPVSAIIAFTVLCLFLLNPLLLFDAVDRFVRKGDTQVTVAESFESSRGRGIEGQWRDFNAFPLFGIGFGVSLDPSFQPILDPFTGLPLSAPVEKGFLPTAILQETGIVGAMFFIIFLFGLTRRAFSNPDIVLPWIFLTCLFVNFGEMIFFSAGGLGLLTWLLIGWATSPPWERKRAP